MKWSADEKWLLDVAEETGDVAGALLRKPDLSHEDYFYLQAFWQLYKDRTISEAGVGPITWTVLNAYANRYEITGEEFDRFETCLNALDSAYREHIMPKN